MKFSERIKIKQKYKKNVRPVIGGLCILSGAVFMLIPFIPLGYILILGGIFLLAPYIPGLDKLIDKIKHKDKKNHMENAEDRVSDANDRIGNKITRNKPEEEYEK